MDTYLLLFPVLGEAVHGETMGFCPQELGRNRLVGLGIASWCNDLKTGTKIKPSKKRSLLRKSKNLR